MAVESAPIWGLEGWAFHHVGYACRSLDRDRRTFEGLGYVQAGAEFIDPRQGVRGCFMELGAQRIELLENLEGSQTLTPWLQSGVSMYHLAYELADIEQGVAHLREMRAKLISGPAPAVAFEGRRICFMMLPNRLLVELIEFVV